MALHAQIHLQVRAEPRGVHDARPNVFRLRARGPHHLKMIAARTVASLAIDALRQFAGEDGIAARSVMSGGNLRDRVVAAHALVGNEAAGLGMRQIETWTHGPIPALLRIPAEREFDVASAGHPM